MTGIRASGRRRLAAVAVLALLAALALQALGINLAYSQTLSVKVWEAAEDPGVNPDWAGWDSVPLGRVPLTAQGVTAPIGGGSVPSVAVQAVHFAGDLVLRVSWADGTEDDSTARAELFSDAVAVQFPAVAGASVPAICMGQADGAVNIWHWRADSNAGVSALPVAGDGYVDRYDDTSETYYPAAASGNPFAAASPVQNLLAGGFGTLTPSREQVVDGSGRHEGAEWAVVLRRSFAPPGADQPQFEVGQEVDVAFAVWNGSKGERDGIKSVSQFVRFSFEAAPVPPTADESAQTSLVTPSSAGYIAVGIFAGAVLVLLLGALIWFGFVAKAYVDKD